MVASTTNPDHDVFLSYSREDRDVVAPIARELEKAGLTVWWDTRIGAGIEFDRVIEANLAGARCVVVVWSERSTESEWVRAEANEGLRRGILVPISIDDTEPPLAFRRRQTLQLDGTRQSLNLLVDSVRHTVATGAASVVDGTERAVAGAVSRARRAALLRGLAAAVLMASGFAAAWYWIGTETSASPLAVTISLPGYDDESVVPHLAISATGRYVAFVGREPGQDNEPENWLYLKARDQIRPAKIEGSRGASTPFFSPDELHVAFFAQGSLQRASVDGGKLVRVARIPEGVVGAAWCDNDTIIFANGYRSPLRKVNASGGTISEITEIGGVSESHRHPVCLPGGNLIYNNQLSGLRDQIWVYDAQAASHRYLLDGYQARVVSGDLLVFKRGRDYASIWAARFDPRALRLTTDPVPVEQFVGGSFDLSQSGDLIYSDPVVSQSQKLIVKDTTGDVLETLVLEEMMITDPSFSPGGSMLAVTRWERGVPNIWIYELANDLASRQLTFEGGMMPIWSVDGSSITYLHLGTGLVSKSLNGDQAELVVAFSDIAYPIQWTEDGFLYALVNLRTAGDIYFRGNDGTLLEVDVTETASTSAAISPDGRWVAYSNEETGRQEIYVRQFPNGGTRWRVSEHGGLYPTWTSDGAWLYFASGSQVARVSVLAQEEFAFGAPEVVAKLGRPGNFVMRKHGISADGSRLALIDQRRGPPTQTYVTNFGELARQALAEPQ